VFVIESNTSWPECLILRRRRITQMGGSKSRQVKIPVSPVISYFQKPRITGETGIF
jgi:hypothetical protein